MSSHHEWAEEVIADHDLKRPFAPENGQPLKFSVGEKVVFTSEFGVRFEHKIAGIYRPTHECALYALGARYILDGEALRLPVAEKSLEVAV